MSIKLVKGGGGAIMVANENAALVGEPFTQNGVVLLQGPDDVSAGTRRNAYYPNETVVFQADKALATDLTADDDEIFYDTSSGLATAGPAGGSVVKVGRKMPGLAADIGGTTSDEFVQFIHSQR